MKKSLIALAAIGALMTTTPAFADNVQIKYKDLDLSSPEGQKTLDRRIDRAAREICGVDSQQSGSRLPNRQVQRCYNDAKKQASQQIAAIVSEQRLGG